MSYLISSDGKTPIAVTNREIKFKKFASAEVLFESPVQKDIREREAEMAKGREDMQRELVQKAFGVGVTEAWEEFNEEAKTSLVESAKKFLSENSQTTETA